MRLIWLAALLPASLAAAAPQPKPSDIPLTADTAVELALARSPALKAARARAQAEKAEARAAARPEEPRLAAFHESGRGDGRTQVALTFDLWSLAGFAGRRRAGGADLRRADALLAETALALAAETRAALYEVEAASAAYVLRRDAADELAAAAGSDAKAADAAQAAIDADRAEAVLQAARSRLARLMSVPTDSGWWTLANLPEPPETEPDAAALSALARERRPELQAALEAAKSASERAASWSSANAGLLRVGVASEKQPDGSRLTGPAVEMDIPLFATMVPRLQAVEARSQEAGFRADDADAALVAALEALRARLIGARRVARRCYQNLIPARERALTHSAAPENRAALLAARLEGIAALQDYWTTRVALEGAAGGSIETSTGEKK